MKSPIRATTAAFTGTRARPCAIHTGVAVTPIGAILNKIIKSQRLDWYSRYCCIGHPSAFDVPYHLIIPVCRRKREESARAAEHRQHTTQTGGELQKRGETIDRLRAVPPFR